MKTGNLSISRGHQLLGESDSSQRLALVPVEKPAPPPSDSVAAASSGPRPLSIDERLTALERLTRLAELGALTAEEFAGEKALILSGQAKGKPAAQPVSFSPAEPRRSKHGPSLAGRLFDWRLVPVGLIAGIGLSFAAQPESTLRAFDEALRLVGI